MSSNSEQRSLRLNKLIAAVCIGVPFLTIGLIVFVSLSVLRVVERSNQRYAKWHMGDLLVEYLQDNDNQWPESWEQLEDRFPEHGMFGYSFEDIQTVICIDFSVSQGFIFDHLDEIRTGKIRLVSTCSGDNSHYEGHDPNEMLANYFEHVRSEKDSHDQP